MEAGTDFCQQIHGHGQKAAETATDRDSHAHSHAYKAADGSGPFIIHHHKVHKAKEKPVTSAGEGPIEESSKEKDAVAAEIETHKHGHKEIHHMHTSRRYLRSYRDSL